MTPESREFASSQYYVCLGHYWIWKSGQNSNPSLADVPIQYVAYSGKKTGGRVCKHLFRET
jgi:hypothetical protein